MPTAKTVTGKQFVYSGSLQRGLEVEFQSSTTKVSPLVIAAIREQIEKRSPVFMGANRSPLVQNSIGETLSIDYRVSPQVLSYVIPLLVEEGFCTVNSKKPIVVTRRR